MAGERILIVEDDVLHDGVPLEQTLVSEGYCVVGIARSTKEAVAMSDEHRPEVVLMDIEIPRTIGADPVSYEGIRAAELIASKHSPSFVFVTSHTPADALMQSVAAISPGTTFVRKPYRDAQILADVKLAIMKRRPASIKVFVCYARKDHDLEDELRTFLGAMSTVGMTFWDDQELEIGSPWPPRLEEVIASAQSAVLLVSMHFMTSDIIRKMELPALVEAAEKRNLLLVPVFLDPIPQPLLEETGLDNYTGINGPNDPIRDWSRFQRQDGWKKLCERLFEALKRRQSR